MEKLVMSVPEAGARYYGASRNRSYELAREGLIPTIKVGKRREVVPIVAMERKFAELAAAACAHRAEAAEQEATA